MTDDENERLRKEVERQTRLIDVLLDSNTQLKQALAWCHHLLAKPLQPDYSNDAGAEAVAQKKENIQTEKDGVNQLPDDLISRINGVIREFDHIRNQIIGVNQLADVFPSVKDGVNQLPDALRQSMDGVNLPANVLTAQHDPSAPSNNGPGIDAPLATLQEDAPSKPIFDVRQLSRTLRYDGKEVALFSITPQEIAEGKSAVSYHKLHALLRNMIPKASGGGLMNTAQILMKLHESPVQPMKKLQQLTHLSEDGLTKRIMAMKKFELIVRAPGRQLLLTAKARHLLEEAR